MPKTEMPGRAIACLSALLLAGGLAACGGSSTSSHTSANAAAPRGSAVTTSGSGGARSGSQAGRMPTGTGQRRALGSTGAPPHRATITPAQTKAFRSALVQFASCLRQNGANIPAPNRSGKGPLFGAKGLNTNTPQYRAALGKCRGVLMSAFRQAARTAASAKTGRR